MKATLTLRLARVCACLALVLSAHSLSLAAEPLTLKLVVELALAHSTTAAGAGAGQQRAFASYREAHNQYLPQFLLGSGLGASWGYPLSLEGAAPSLQSHCTVGVDQSRTSRFRSCCTRRVASQHSSNQGPAQPGNSGHSSRLCRVKQVAEGQHILATTV